MSTQNQSQSNPQEPNRTLSDLIVDYLEQFGVEYVFGIPGVHVMGMYEALARSERRGGPRAIMNRHESGAVFMAAGYARETGKIGVCCVTAGAGATNAITAMMVANAEHLPVLVITGQAMVPLFGLGAVQESSPYESIFPDIVNTVGMLEHGTCYNTIVTNPRQLEGKVAAALTAALQGPLGGVAHLAIPQDILETPSSQSVSYPHLSQLLATSSDFVEAEAFEKLWQEVEQVVRRKGRVTFLIGHECAGASEEIITLAELLNAPILTTVRGRAWVDPYHPLARGIHGPLWGHKSAFQAIDEEADLLLAAGTSFTQAATGAWHPSVLNDKLVHLHPVNTYFLRSPMARLHVRGTIKTIFSQLITRLEEMLGQQAKGAFNGRDEDKRTSTRPSTAIELHKPERLHDDSAPIKPQRLIYELMQNFPPETRYVVDIGNCLPWTAHYLLQQHPEHYLNFFAQPSMGSAPGGSIGVAMGAPNTPVVCVTGDGSFLMYGQEIGVAVSERLPVIFVILNDHAFGMVKNRHRQIGKEAVDLDLPCVDFSLMAQAVGATGITIRHPDDFAQIDYQALISRPGPTVLDVHIDPDEILPMGLS